MDLRKYSSLLMVMLILALVAGAIAEDEIADEELADDGTGNGTGDVALSGEDSPVGDAGALLANGSNNTSSIEAGAAITVPEAINLHFIWSMALSSGEQITVALNQSEAELFGAAKYEGAEAWNGIIIGSVTGDMVELVLTYPKGSSLISTMMNGTYANDTIKGTFSVYDNFGKIGSGTFSAMSINPVTTGYTPAVVATPATAVAAAPVVDNSQAAGNGTTTTATGETTSTSGPVQLSSSGTKFHDVSQDEEEIFSSPVSMVPPGMGGSGLV